MKSITAILSLIIAANVMATDIIDSTLMTYASPFFTTTQVDGGFGRNKAVMILNDAQEYAQSGKVSVLLGQAIKATQELNIEVSESEAVEMLTNQAETILSK